MIPPGLTVKIVSLPNFSKGSYPKFHVQYTKMNLGDCQLELSRWRTNHTLSSLAVDVMEATTSRLEQQLCMRSPTPVHRHKKVVLYTEARSWSQLACMDNRNGSRQFYLRWPLGQVLCFVVELSNDSKSEPERLLREWGVVVEASPTFVETVSIEKIRIWERCASIRYYKTRIRKDWIVFNYNISW